MSDADYAERMGAMRRRLWWLAGGMLLASCLGSAMFGIFYDSCTRSFDREPRSVVESYLTAVRLGNLDGVRACWEPDAYFSLETGCSEICLSKFLGADFEIEAIRLEEAAPSGPAGLRQLAIVELRCSAGGLETGTLELGTPGAEVPWQHWNIQRSTIGGSVADPWCR